MTKLLVHARIDETLVANIKKMGNNFNDGLNKLLMGQTKSQEIPSEFKELWDIFWNHKEAIRKLLNAEERPKMNNIMQKVREIYG